MEPYKVLCLDWYVLCRLHLAQQFGIYWSDLFNSLEKIGFVHRLWEVLCWSESLKEARSNSFSRSMSAILQLCCVFHSRKHLIKTSTTTVKPNGDKGNLSSTPRRFNLRLIFPIDNILIQEDWKQTRHNFSTYDQSTSLPLPYEVICKLQFTKK